MRAELDQSHGRQYADQLAQCYRLEELCQNHEFGTAGRTLGAQKSHPQKMSPVEGKNAVSKVYFSGHSLSTYHLITTKAK